MDLHAFVFGVYPYIATVVFLLGSWIRFDHEQYTWKSDSSQLLSKKYMRFASNAFHIGIIAIFFGHLVGLLTPHQIFLNLGVTDMAHQYTAIYAGALFGAVCLTGGVILWLRRMFNRRVRAASRWMDINILGWLMFTLVVGLSTLPVSLGHAAHGDASTMISLSEWIQSVVALNPHPELLRNVDLIYQVHLFVGMSVFLFFPFTRLVHVWSAPVGYLTRAYQVVRMRRR
ncbi:MAG: respiratory nitrate reductase subunit gamma [Pseudomonadota bacterium]